MLNAAAIISLIRDAQITLHTTGGVLDIEGRGLRLPSTVLANVERQGNFLHVSFTPPIVVEKAASLLWFNFDASISALQITPMAVFAITNRGRYKIMEHAEPA